MMGSQIEYSVLLLGLTVSLTSGLVETLGFAAMCAAFRRQVRLIRALTCHGPCHM